MTGRTELYQVRLENDECYQVVVLFFRHSRITSAAVECISMCAAGHHTLQYVTGVVQCPCVC
jgi:hypothetical protein